MPATHIIDPRIWADPDFQKVWAGKWPINSPAPKSRSHPQFVRRRITANESTCIYLRNRFRKIRLKLFPLVFAKFGDQCLICKGNPATLIDHVLPICWGGTNDICNFQPICQSCNSWKGGRLPSAPIEILESNECQH